MAQDPTKVSELYNGRIKIGFWEGRHRYSIIENDKPKNEWLTSVTSVTGIVDKSRILIRWATNLAKDFLIEKINEGTEITQQLIEEAVALHSVKKDEAANKGSQVHAWIEQYIKGEKPELPEDENVVAAINAFIDWEKKHSVKWIATEKIVYSLENNYVGLLDALAIVDGKKRVVDFKTSSGIYNEYMYQVAAYRLAYQEESQDTDLENSIIVRFDKETAEFEVKECVDHEKDVAAFLGALALKKREKELEAEYRKQ